MSFFRSILPMASIVLVLVILFAAILVPKWQTQKILSAKVEENQLILDRLKDRIESLNQSGRDAALPSEYRLQAVDRKEALSTVQDIILGIAQRLEVRPKSFGSAVLKRDTVTETAAFEFEAQTSLVKLYQFLAAIEALTPKLAIGSLSVRPSNTRVSTDGTFPLQMRLIVWGFWEGGS